MWTESEGMIFEQRLNTRSIPTRKNSKCKGPEVDAGFHCSRREEAANVATAGVSKPFL